MANKQIRRTSKPPFSQIEAPQIPRSSFDLSRGLKTTFDAGLLIPIFYQESLPGDTIKVDMTAFIRLATPLKPIMDNLYFQTYWFSVENRLVWENWKKFCGEQASPGDSIDYVVPTFSSLVPNTGSIYDYFGLPIGTVAFGGASALPFRAYAKIFDEWFRNQNLQAGTQPDIDDGPDAQADYELFRVNKKPDYFTSCLPFPQKGTAVSFLSGQAPVSGIGVIDTAGVNPTNRNVYETTTGSAIYEDTHAFASAGIMYADADPATDYPLIFAELGAGTGDTINTLRQAFQIQKLLERDARGGTRYPEVILSHFKVVSPDGRQQRSEFLGSGSTPIQITPVAQTGETSTTPQGNLAAMGTAAPTGHGFTKSFTEHGMVIGLATVRADITYQQGTERHWRRKTRYDFYWPALSHIGEQSVLNGEIYSTSSIADDDVFGYQERYAEYRHAKSQITGLFRSIAASSLDFWHLAQEFGSTPSLNEAFIQEDPPVDRVIAVPAEPQFIMDAWFKVKAARPIPMYGTPGLIDHF